MTPLSSAVGMVVQTRSCFVSGGLFGLLGSQYDASPLSDPAFLYLGDQCDISDRWDN